MDALLDATTVENSSFGFTPTAIPEPQHVEKGVSVEYVPQEDDRKKWYLFRASYGREDLAAELLRKLNIYAYIPKREETVKVDGRIRHSLQSIVPNFVFAYMTEADAMLCVKGPAQGDHSFDERPLEERKSILRLNTFISFYYDHFREVEGKNPPLVIAFHEMRNLILATRTHAKDVMILQRGDYTFKTDEEVEVVQGYFKGIRGRVIRAKQQQRILIQLTGFATFGTTYIPTHFLKPLTSDICEK